MSDIAAMLAEPTIRFELLTEIDIGRTVCSVPVASGAAAVHAIRGWALERLAADTDPARWSDPDYQDTVGRLQRAVDSVPVLEGPYEPSSLQAFADEVSGALERALAIPANEHEHRLLAHYDLRFVVRAVAP